MSSQKRAGFTIIELLIVVVVIGILAGISIMGYGAWRKNVATAQVKNDLNAIAAAMESARNFNSNYPTTLPTNVHASDGVTLTLDPGSTTTSFCVDATSTTDDGILYYVDSLSRDKGPQVGTCATRTGLPVPGAPGSFVIDSASSSQVSLSWTAGSYASTYTVQCAQDAAYIVSFKEAVGIAGLTTTITGLEGYSSYVCRIKSVNTTGVSSWISASVSTTNTTAPSSLIAVASSSSVTQIDLTWGAVAGATNYTIDRATDAAFTLNLVSAPSGGPTTSYASTGLSAGTRYYYRVKALANGVTSAWSSSTNSLTKLPVCSEIGSGRFKIVARHSGKILDVVGASTADGARIQQNTYSSGAHQQWDVVSLGGGQYNIFNAASNKILEVGGASSADGANVNIWSLSPPSAIYQRWNISATDSGYCKVLNANSGKTLDVAGASSADGANIAQYPYGGATWDQFSFQYP